MWWSERLRGFALALCLVCAACGFTPLYSEGSPARDIDGQFVVEDQGGPFAFAMRERLHARLGATRSGPYRLRIETTIDQEERAIREDRSVLRYNLDAVARFAVISTATGNVVFEDSARSFTAYSAIASPFATRSAEDDARRRLAVALADQIVLRLAATAGTWLE